MQTDNAWLRFQKSGKVTDYLYFVNVKNGGEKSERTGQPLYHKSTCDKGNENRGERPFSHSFQ